MSYDPDSIPDAIVEGRITFTGLLVRHQARDVTPDPRPRYLSREWFEEWLAGHPDGIAFIDERFREVQLRARLRTRATDVDAREWLVMLLRRHGRHAEADVLMDGRGDAGSERLAN